MSGSDDALRTGVREYYSQLQSTNDLRTSACTVAARPPPSIRRLIAEVPREITDKFYGCGCPVSEAWRGSGMTILDLGSGSGRDAYVASALVGARGRVIGVDMTDAQLDVARRHASAWTADAASDRAPLDFRCGLIEALIDGDARVEKGSVDVCISNCVVNLSPDKLAVLRSVHDALKCGGEFHFSDVFCDRRLSADARKHPLLVGECIGGALYEGDFRRMCRHVGFCDPRVLSRSAPLDLSGLDDVPEARALLGNARFYSVTYRLFKLSPDAGEDACEDYGQVALYKGTLPGHAHAYALDETHSFETRRPVLVCGNTAAMITESWLSAHFDVIGQREQHFGLFDCSGGGGGAGGGAETAQCDTGGACC